MSRADLYLIVKIQRDNLIESSLNCLINSGQSLRKPLKVIFEGEPGIDEGGVQKEFFQLLIKGIFDPSYGMFEHKEDENLYWFKKDTFETPLKFELIGIILGLAIFNSVILDVHLPLAVYKKLLGQKPDIDDLSMWDLSMAKGLKAIEQNDSPNLEQELYTPFVVEYESWGEIKKEELKEGGEKIFVNQENKLEYIDLYIDWFFNKSVNKIF